MKKKIKKRPATHGSNESAPHIKESLPERIDRPSLIAHHIFRHPFMAVAIVGVLLSLPILILGYPFNTYDTVWHTLYYKHFSMQLFAGELYPRWLNLLNGGYGGPTFFYYPPMGYYFTSIFYPLKLSILYQLGFGAALGVVISGINAFLWLKEITSRGAALVTAIIYMLMPYYVYDIYGRGAFAESFAFAWMPLILFFAVRVARGSRLAVAGMAVSFAVLCMTHLLTTMMFSPVLLVYVLIISDRTLRLRNLAFTSAATILGSGLSAVYLLPAMTYQNYVWFEEFRTGGVYFEKALLTLSLAIGGSYRYFWFIIPTGLVTVACFLFSRPNLDEMKRREQAFWSGAIAFSIFMMLYVSMPVWYFIRPLQMLQFPWRFNAIIAISILPIIAFAIASAKRPYSVGMKLTTLVIGAFVVYAGINLWRTADLAYQPADAERIEFSAKDEKYALDVHALWPRDADRVTLADIEEIVARAPKTDGEPAKAYFADGGGNVGWPKWQPRSINLETDSPDGGTLTVSQFYYPGWRARLINTNEDLTVQPTHDFVGLITLQVPPGRHSVNLTLEMLWPEFAGWLISGASGLVAFSIFFVFLFFPNSRSKRASRDSLPDDSINVP